jgi:hypothetical protein
LPGRATRGLILQDSRRVGMASGRQGLGNASRSCSGCPLVPLLVPLLALPHGVDRAGDHPLGGEQADRAVGATIAHDAPRACPRAGRRPSPRREHLDPVVAGVRDVDVAGVAHRHAPGARELPVAGSVAPPLGDAALGQLRKQRTRAFSTRRETRRRWRGRGGSCRSRGGRSGSAGGRPRRGGGRGQGLDQGGQGGGHGALRGRSGGD